MSRTPPTPDPTHRTFVAAFPNPLRPKRPRRRVLAAVATIALLGATLFLFPAPTVASETVSPWFHHDETIRLKTLDARVTVQDDIALTELNITFEQRNVTYETTVDDSTYERRYTDPRELVVELPLPSDAALTRVALHVDDEVWEGEVKVKATARSMYEDARDRGDDAILLEHADDESLRVSIHVPWGAQRALEIAYAQSIPLDTGARNYRLDTSRLAALPAPLESFAVHVELTSTPGFTALTTPGLPLKTDERTDHTFLGSWTATDTAVADDVVVTWTETGSAWIHALQTDQGTTSTYQHPSGRDTVLASIVHAPETDGGTLPRDMVFVLDRSGSMGAEKMEQARESLREVLLTLRPDDRYALITFDHQVGTLTEGLVQADTTNVRATRDQLTRVHSGGSTDLYAAIEAALATIDDTATSGRVPLVVLLTDGQPTAGYTDPQGIVRRLVANNDHDAAFHMLAIGLDADDTFMEDIALATGGSLTVLDPDIDLQDRLSTFYATLDDPVLTDIQIEVLAPESTDLLPRRLPALYADGTLRFSFLTDLDALDADEPLRIRITGVGASGTVTHLIEAPVDQIAPQPLAGLLWGRAQADDLLSRERAGDAEVTRDQIVEHAILYRIVTPYTSWVIVKPETAEESTESADGSDDEAAAADATLYATDGGGTTASRLAGDGYDSADDSAADSFDASGRDHAADGDDAAGSRDDASTPGFGVGAWLAAFAIVGVVAAARRRR